MTPHARDLVSRVSAVRRYLYRRSIWAAGSWLVAGAVLGWVFAWIWSGDSGWRPGSMAPLVIDGLILVWLGMGVWLFRRGVTRWLDDEPLAHSIEGALSLSRGELRGPLELSSSVPEGVSVSLAEHASRRAVARMGSRPDPELAGAMGQRVQQWNRRGWGALVAGVAMVLILTALAPQRSVTASAGLAAPLRVLSGPSLPALGVEPGDAEVLRGSDVRVHVEAPGRRTVELRWQQVGEVPRTRTVDVVDGSASWVIENVAATVDYSVRGDDGASSGSFRLTAVDPLFVSDLEIEVTFPPHTGLPSETFRGAAPALRLPAGSRFDFDGRANRPLASATLLNRAGDGVVDLPVDGGAFAGSWNPSASGVYTWRFSDVQGGRPEVVPEPLELELVPDAAPLVEIVEPGVDTVLAADLRQPVGIEMADDYGVSALEIVAWRATALGEEREPVVQRFDLGGARLASARPVLSFQSWGMLPGDEVRYLARVVDNSPARQVSETRTFVLRMPSADELRREMDQALEDAADRLSEMAETAGAQAEQNREDARRRELTRSDRAGQQGGQPSPGEQGFQEREAMQQALEEQEQMLQAVDSLGRELDAMEQRMAETGQADPEMRAQMRELQSLLDELGGDDLSRQTERLSEALQREDTSEAGRTLEELAQEQEEFRDRLEESLERFRRAAAEQDFRATRTEAEELARLEQALADAMREDEGSELRAEQQEALAERAEGLEASLDRLEERLRELGEERAADGVRSAGQQAQQASEGMREAQRQADQGQRETAASQAEDASQQLDQAARDLQQAQQDMAQQRLQQTVEGLQRAADDALALARRQGELRQQMREASSEQLAGMRADEASLMEGVENLAENLQLSTEGQMPGAREISAQMGRAMESLQRTATAMDRPRSLGGSPYAEAERAVGDLNRLALMTMAAADQLGQAAQGQAQQGQQMQQQLEELAQQQGDLVNQAGQIAPMQLGQQAMSQQMQQMSQGQQSISDQLGEMSNEPASEGALGDLQQMAAEAAELAEQLAEGRLDPETVQRQERLFHRLLDAGRSLEREEFSEERESDEATEFERGSVLSLDESDMGVLQFRMPDAEELQRLSPGVRRLILDYFQRLNRGNGGEGGGSMSAHPSHPPLLTLMALVLLGALPSMAGAQAPGSGTNRLLRQAAGLEASGDLDGAERVLREVLAQDPRSTGALFSIERVLTRKGEPGAVLPLVADFLAVDPGRGQVRLLELRVLAEMDSLDAVRQRADEWRETHPTEATYRDLVELYGTVFGEGDALGLVGEGRSSLGDPGLLAFQAGDLHERLGNRDAALTEWEAGVGDDGSGVAPVARRLRDLSDGREEAMGTVVRGLADSPVFARRRAAAALTVELRMEAEALELTRAVADELGGRARSTFLAEIADRARELSVDAVATWAYDELGADAETPAERRAFDQRLVEVSLSAGDTAAAVEAERRIARSYPEGSSDRRQATLRALRLGMHDMDAETLRGAFDAFLEEFPGALELDETAAAVARGLQREGDPEGAMAVLERSEGPLSAAERAYLLLDMGRLQEAREILSVAVDGMAPSEATGTIRLLTLLGRLSPGSAELLAGAAAAARRGDVAGAVARLESGEGVADDGERATLLAHAARLSEDAGDAAGAARIRTVLLERHPQDTSIPEAALALARYHATREGGRDRAIDILEELIASRPNAAVVPSARAELSRLRGAP